MNREQSKHSMENSNDQVRGRGAVDVPSIGKQRDFGMKSQRQLEGAHSTATKGHGWCVGVPLYMSLCRICHNDDHPSHCLSSFLCILKALQLGPDAAGRGKLYTRTVPHTNSVSRLVCGYTMCSFVFYTSLVDEREDSNRFNAPPQAQLSALVQHT